MRRTSHGMDVQRMDDGRLISVNLGADFTAEHEWGIKDLARDFQLNEKAAPGVPRRQVHAVPKGRHWSDEPDAGVVFRAIKHSKADKYDPWAGKETYIVAYTPYGGIREVDWYEPTEHGFVAAWSDGDFAVHFDPDHKRDAEDLYNALLKEDIAFLWGSTKGNPFSNAGLCLAIVSRLPHEYVEGLREMAEDGDALKAAAEATGIKAEIDAANRAERERTGHWRQSHGYFALSPRWDNKEKGTVVFWLNPENQQDNAFGWYTVDQLRQWLRGEGPVIENAEAKQKKAAAKR